MKIKSYWKDIFWKRLLTKYYRFFCPKLYSSIYDAPAWVWEEYIFYKDENILTNLIKNGSFFELSTWKNYIFYNEKNYLKWLKAPQFSDLLNKLYSEVIFISKPEKYIKQLMLKKEIALLRWEAAETGNRFLETIADLKEAELESMIEKDAESEESSELTYYSNCVKITDRLKVNVDSRKITIFEYRNFLNVLSKENGSNS